MSISPLRHETVQSRIYEELRMMLMTGKFLPGQALKINDLSGAFGTSAQPVRESIRQLLAEHALEAVANRSARVPVYSFAQLEDLQRTRLALECLATEIAVEKITEAEVQHLEQVVQAELSSDERLDTIGSISRNLDFHFSLYRVSGSEVLLPMIESLWMRLGPQIRSAAENFDAREGRGAEMHLQVLEALKQRDVALARNSIERDINRTFELMRDILTGTST